MRADSGGGWGRRPPVCAAPRRGWLCGCEAEGGEEFLLARVEGVPGAALFGDPLAVVAVEPRFLSVEVVDAGVGVLPADAPGRVPPGVQCGHGGVVGPGPV